MQMHSYLCCLKQHQKPSGKVSLRESGGSKRKSGAPDFFRLPCGAKAVLRIPAVYFAPRLISKMRIYVYLAVYWTKETEEW
ncbi:hypothetical protein [Mucilaginibacter aquatilis]|uniref:Uncharacterized protein n=1 Tax=Mucilaginibacter aquatilis TaxID=1517760 RepID=A0A6I4I6K4_9SPHI|nr:hypothetical protein [Mucilaginibacter aquatilis]MVN90507.1 hypothetical protein [Mucilaginibacter aquatilis]